MFGAVKRAGEMKSAETRRARRRGQRRRRPSREVGYRCGSGWRRVRCVNCLPRSSKTCKIDGAWMVEQCCILNVLKVSGKVPICVHKKLSFMPPARCNADSFGGQT